MGGAYRVIAVMPRSGPEDGGINMLWRREWRIRDVLIILLILTLAPFFALEVFRAVQDTQRQGDEASHRTEIRAAEAAQITDDFLGFTERSIASFAAAPSVRSLDAESSRAFLEGVRSQHPNYEGVFLLREDGTEVASTQAGMYERLNRERPFVQRTLVVRRMVASEALQLPPNGRSVLLLTYPVVGGQGDPVGVLGVALNINRLSSVIGYVRSSPGSIVLLLQRDSTVIGANSDPKAWVGRPLSDRAGSTGTSIAKLRDGVERVTASHGVESAPWRIVAGIPQAEVNAARRETLTRIAEELALAVAATVLLAWIMLRRVLAPIRVLSAGARDFAAGLLDRRIPLRRGDELGALADVLNSMAGRLQQRLDEEAAHAEALRSLNRLQTEFVATASHELRTPVTAIRTYAEALLRPEISNEGVRRDCLEGINRTSARLAQLARRLLDVSKIDSGQITLDPGAVDVAVVARAAIAQAGCQEGDSVVLQVQAGCTIVEADAERLEEVLDNLIGNALKFTSPAANVTVSVEPVAGGTRVAVRDTGPGIPTGELPRIFDRFYQVPNAQVQGAAARCVGGSGLGLYIARAYVQAMGGRLWVDSEIERGSTFFVLLPASVELAAIARPDEDIDAATTTPALGRRRS